MEHTKTEHDRIREAYFQMGEKAKYRPQAPSDGFGNIQLTEEEIADPKRLAEEASAYADRFITEEHTREFAIGLSNYRTNRAFVYTIEAARILCCGLGGEAYAIKLLEMAVEDVKNAIRESG